MSRSKWNQASDSDDALFYCLDNIYLQVINYNIEQFIEEHKLYFVNPTLLKYEYIQFELCLKRDIIIQLYPGYTYKGEHRNPHLGFPLDLSIMDLVNMYTQLVARLDHSANFPGVSRKLVESLQKQNQKKYSLKQLATFQLPTLDLQYIRGAILL
jgi:hypothetical protein